MKKLRNILIINRIKKVDNSDLFCVALFSFMLCIFAPFEIYLSNKGYFFFEGYEMLGYSVLAFCICFTVCATCLFCSALINDRFHSMILGLFFGGTIALYIQGNWDITDYGAWNGSNIDWKAFSSQKIVFGIVFVVLIVGCGIWGAIKSHQLSAIAKYVSMFVNSILIVTLGVLLVSNGGMGKEKEYIATVDEELQLSNSKNMIVLLLDAYDSKSFSDIVLDNEDYLGIFNDFTYYPDTVGCYSSTDMSVPMIITGLDYKNDMLFGDYLNIAYENSDLMNWIDKNGWEKDIYFDGLLPQGREGYSIANSKPLMRVVNNRKMLMNYMYTMVLFRYMPQPIKNHFYFYADNIKATLNMVVGDYEPYSASNFELYDVIDTTSANKEKAVFQYIHVEGAHEPFNLTEDFVQSDNETSYEDECKGVLLLVNKFLDTLKENGVYDDTVIVIMADHGYYDKRQNPLLLVKGYDEHHDFSISDAPVSYYDLQTIFVNLISGKSDSTNVVSYSEKEDEEGRVFRSVPWNTHLNYDTYSGTIEEIRFYGGAKDVLNCVDNVAVYASPMESDYIIK